MGFSVPGAVVILFVGLLVSVGTLYPVVETGLERGVRAQEEAQDRLLHQQNTNFVIEDATYDATHDILVVNATNTGTTALSIAKTDGLVDGQYIVDPFVFQEGALTEPVRLDIFLDTYLIVPDEVELWLPGETITFVFEDYTTAPTRMTLVSETGLSRGETVVVA